MTSQPDEFADLINGVAGGVPLIPGETRIKFVGERLRYTVRATDGRFVVCTKPFNPRRTVLYSIIDFKRWVRGRENLIFGRSFVTTEECEEALVRLMLGESEVSHRYCVDLEIEEITRKT